MRARLLKWGGACLLVVLLLAGLAFLYIQSGFPPPPSLSGQIKSETLTVGGLSRSFHFYVPDERSSEPALLFVLHGSKGNWRMIHFYTGRQFDRVADREGFVVVYPDGYKRHWNDCRASASYAANQENIDDLAFFRAMIAYFTERYGTSREKVFAVGHSNGGHMAYKLALLMPDEIRAVAAVSANLPVEDNLDCQPSEKPISVAIVNGTADPINPYDGGLVELFGDTSRGTVRSSTMTAHYWTHLAGIDREPEVLDLPEVDGDSRTSITLTRWSSDDAHTIVWLYTLTGSGHVIPSRVVKPRFGRFFGGNAGDMEAADELWKFFQAASNSEP